MVGDVVVLVAGGGDPVVVDVAAPLVVVGSSPSVANAPSSNRPMLGPHPEPIVSHNPKPSIRCATGATAREYQNLTELLVLKVINPILDQFDVRNRGIHADSRRVQHRGAKNDPSSSGPPSVGSGLPVPTPC
ncbi:MAG: hypothetical protein K0V04_41265, partial [Deltaproteobacteria bacterium]|nr:hypothetical protein [Deltaproteobacteria bacterium]